MSPLPEYLSPGGVARALQVSRRTVYRWLDSGELPAIRIGRTWRVDHQDITGKKKP